MIDVSVLVSSLAGGWFDSLVEALREERLQPILSPALLAELREVVSRDRLRRWFDLEDAQDLAEALEVESVVVEPESSVSVCRDSDDNYLLALAETSGAQYLVTRDEDLLTLQRWGQTVIIPPGQFLGIIAATSRIYRDEP